MFKYSVKTVLFSLLLLLSPLIKAAGDNYPVGAKASGMGNAAVMFSDVWSLYHNQAGLAFLNQTTLGFHFENRFIIEDLSLAATGFVLPTKTGVFGLSLSYWGFQLYNETKAGLAYSRNFGEKFSAGIQLDYMNVHISEFENKGAVVIEGGLQAQPVDKLWVGAHIYNPTQTKISEYHQEKLPTIMRLGTSYMFGSKVLLSVETEISSHANPVYKSGLEYQFIDNLFLRLGISTNPTLNTFGLGYVFKNIMADFAFSNHPELGIIPHFSLNYRFGKEK